MEERQRLTAEIYKERVGWLSQQLKAAKEENDALREENLAATLLAEELEKRLQGREAAIRVKSRIIARQEKHIKGLEDAVAQGVRLTEEWQKSHTKALEVIKVMEEHLSKSQEHIGELQGRLFLESRPVDDEKLPEK